MFLRSKNSSAHGRAVNLSYYLFGDWFGVFIVFHNGSFFVVFKFNMMALYHRNGINLPTDDTDLTDGVPAPLSVCATWMLRHFQHSFAEQN